MFPREIIGSSDWLASLWERRDRIADKRATLVWGQKDIAFRTKELARWRELFPEARVVTLDDVGHFVSEEAPEVLVDELTRLLI